MDDEQKAKLIALYWEHFDKSDSLKNHQRGQWNDNWEYDDGFANGMSEVFEAIGLDPDVGMPEHIRLERIENSKIVRAMYAEMGLDYDDLRSSEPVKREE